MDVYSFAITLLEIGCRDHRFVVKQFLERSVGPLSVAAVTATGHKGFRPIPKADFVEELPDLWAMVREEHTTTTFVLERAIGLRLNPRHV